MDSRRRRAFEPVGRDCRVFADDNYKKSLTARDRHSRLRRSDTLVNFIIFLEETLALNLVSSTTQPITRMEE
jgi:hypothetical protein